MSRMKKIVIAAIAVVVALLLVVDVAASSYLLNYAIGRAGDGRDRNVEDVVLVESTETEARIQANEAAEALKTAKFLEQDPGDRVEITAEDGVRLSGIVYEQKGGSATLAADDSASTLADGSAAAADTTQASFDASASEGNRWAVVIHGYRDTNQSQFILDMAQHYFAAGFNVLTPDLRASGESEGDYIGMGWLDRLDILAWIDWILAQDPGAQIAIHGVSMGAATTMMVSGEPTPDAVVAFVEDCGYTSVWDVFASELSLRFGLPTFPLLHSASAMASMMAGYDFEEASALEAVARSEKPMLFIHGTADDFIPFDMMGRLYGAKTTGDKEMLVSEGAGHGEAMYELSDAYWETVFNFTHRYMKE